MYFKYDSLRALYIKDTHKSLCVDIHANLGTVQKFRTLRKRMCTVLL